MTGAPEDAAAAHAPWTRAAVRRPGAGAVLYCLPFLGSPAEFYLPLARALPSGVDLCPLEIPGHGDRLHEPALTDLPELAHLLAEVILRDAAGRPLALFGHCSGGLLAFEVARLLTAPHPALLAVSAAPPPRLWARRIGAVRGRPLTAVLPLLAELAGDRRLHRATVTALAKQESFTYLDYRYAPRAALDCPVAVFGGRDDTFVAPEDLEQWSQETGGRTVVRVYPGRHFYLTAHWADVARGLARHLPAARRPAPG
ncbi:alpha/beta fold hydrolase [Streptomyces capparidis]